MRRIFKVLKEENVEILASLNFSSLTHEGKCARGKTNSRFYSLHTQEAISEETKVCERNVHKTSCGLKFSF